MSESPSSVEIQNCLQLNVSKCSISETEVRFVVTVYNPLSRNVSQFVRLPVQPGTYTVQDNNGKLRSQWEAHVSLKDSYFRLRLRENSFWITWVFMCSTLGLPNAVGSGKYTIKHVITCKDWKPYLSLLIICLIYIMLFISILNYLMTLVAPRKLISDFI